MRSITLEQVEGGEILAKDIIDDEGRVLLSKGIFMQVSYLNKLIGKGISEIIVEDKISEGIVINEIIENDTKIETKKVIKAEVKRIMDSREVSLAEIDRVIDMLVNDILSNPDDMLNIKSLQEKDEFTFNHSINVTIMSIVLSKRLFNDYNQIKLIGAGCLLHDIGKIAMPIELLRNYVTLKNEDLVNYQKHPLIGYNLLKDNKNISSEGRLIILQHHERLNGSGFPNGLKEEDISLGAQICGICDEFDLRLSNTAITTESVEYILTLPKELFKKELIDELIKNISIYPEGSTVLINERYVGLVIKNNNSLSLRPIVRIFYDFISKKQFKSKDLDLSTELDYIITRKLLVNINKFL